MPIRKPLSAMPAAIVLAATAACDAITGAEYRTQPARIIFYRDTAGWVVLRVTAEQRGSSTGGANRPAVLERSLVVR
jgi:hypothetical protein